MQRCAASISPCTNRMLWAVAACLNWLSEKLARIWKAVSQITFWFFLKWLSLFQILCIAFFSMAFFGGVIKFFTAKSSDWCGAERLCNGPRSNQSCCRHYASNKWVGCWQCECKRAAKAWRQREQRRDVDAVSLWSGASLQTLGVAEVHNFPAGEQICPSLPGGEGLQAAPPQLVPHCFKLSPALVQAFKPSERDTGEGGRL